MVVLPLGIQVSLFNGIEEGSGDLLLCRDSAKWRAAILHALPMKRSNIVVTLNQTLFSMFFSGELSQVLICSPTVGRL
jgi:hypothetical protein